MMPTKVTIVGVGLIGGSLGLAVKRFHPECEVVGVDRDPAIIDEACQIGAIDRGTIELRDGVRDADYIFLATPIDAILALLRQLPRWIEAETQTLISDVGSTKARICAVARRHLPSQFVGGHPMTGSEVQGLSGADPFMFENAVYVLTPSAGEPDERLETLAAFLARLGAQVTYMDPEFHDRVVAYVSHLPQLLAVSLVNLVGNQKQDQKQYRELAAGGFKDLTRIASSPYAIWEDILKSNHEAVGRAIDDLIGYLIELKGALKAPQRALRDLQERFECALAFRGEIPERSKGIIRPLHRVAVTAPDRPGSLAKITTALYEAGMNIKDIELLKVRENVGGTFHLHLESRDEAERAVRILNGCRFESRMIS
ncbi:MAG: prephenate dehydrogenase/arogenate dehydrogenase family protein [Candidatus Bipolaricaulia bacterium]